MLQSALWLSQSFFEILNEQWPQLSLVTFGLMLLQLVIPNARSAVCPPFCHIRPYERRTRSFESPFWHNFRIGFFHTRLCGLRNRPLESRFCRTNSILFYHIRQLSFVF